MDTEKFMADYDRAVQEINSLGVLIEDEMRRQKLKFSSEFFCWMFETLLQYSLIELAQADDNVSLDEIMLSKRVVRYADVVSLGNCYTGEKYEWADFVNADPDFVKEWLSKVDRLLVPMQYTFISQFATFDSKTAGDSLAEVTKGLVAVLTLLMNADGERSEKEEAAVMNCKIIVTMNKIAELMRGE